VIPELNSALGQQVLRAIRGEPGRQFKVTELAKLLHASAPDVAKTVRLLEAAKRAVTKHHRGQLVVMLAPLAADANHSD
jgi:hypothetical protein